MAAKGQIIHFRAWDGGRAVNACQRYTAGTTSPNMSKVNCQACKAYMTRQEAAA